jgi:hypothetical protein
MEKINSAANLRDAILRLEGKQSDEEKMLKEQLHLAGENMKPINLIKSTFREVVASQDLKDDLINASVGLAAGYVSKVLFQGAMHSRLRKFLGTVLMFSVTKAVYQNPEYVKALGKGLLKVIINKHVLSVHESGTSH